MEKLVGFRHRDEPARRDLTFGAVEVERQRLHTTAALQSRRRLPHVHHEAVGADADERAEARLAWLVALEPRLLKRVGKEALREIARVFRVQAPGQAKVFVDRFPVAFDEVAERGAPGVGIGVANSLDCRMPGCGKAASGAHVIRFHYPPPALSVPCRHGVQGLMRSRKGDGELRGYHIRLRACFAGALRRDFVRLRAASRQALRDFVRHGAQQHGSRLAPTLAESAKLVCSSSMAPRPPDAQLAGQIDRLYQLPLDEFTAARNALAKEAGAAGAEIRALQKPPVAAWAINQVYWRGRPAFHAFNASAAALRAAHTGVVSGKRADLRAAGKAHEEALEAVAKAALAILRDAGQPATDATKQAILTTLRALPASSDPPGRLTQVLQPTGFELLAGLPAAPAVTPARSAAAASKSSSCCGSSEAEGCRADEGVGQGKGGRRRCRPGGAGRRREGAARGIRGRSRNARRGTCHQRAGEGAAGARDCPGSRRNSRARRRNGDAQERCGGTARPGNRRRACGGEGSHRSRARRPDPRVGPGSTVSGEVNGVRP